MTGVSGKTVTINPGTTAKISSPKQSLSPSGSTQGDTINFSTDLAKGDVINFGGVKSGDTVTFGTNNQCNEAILAAQAAAKAGTWVYSIAYGSSKAATQLLIVAQTTNTILLPMFRRARPCKTSPLIQRSSTPTPWEFRRLARRPPTQISPPYNQSLLTLGTIC